MVFLFDFFRERDRLLNMKAKAIFILSFLLFPAISLATSGACSYHGGVNCTAGSDYDGSVVCNDGWRESSVLFSNSCQSQTKTCSVSALNAYLAFTGASGSSDAEWKMAECEKINSQASIPPPPVYNPMPYDNSAQEKYDDEWNNYVEQQNEISARLDAQIELIQQKNAETKLKSEECTKSFGTFSYFDNTENKCVCAKGIDSKTPDMVIINGTCTLPPEKTVGTIKKEPKKTGFLNSVSNAKVEIETPQEPTESVGAVSVPSIEGTKLETPQPLPKKSFWGKLMGFLFGF